MRLKAVWFNHTRPKSPSQDAFFQAKQKRAVVKQQENQLRRLARAWDSKIRSGLKHLANIEWADRRWLGLIPAARTRIRRKAGNQKVTWWVEHDIPPYDRYRCAAYFVELELDESLNFILSVRSGSGTYLVEQPARNSIEYVLAKAAQDPPVIISRRMGPAFD